MAEGKVPVYVSRHTDEDGAKIYCSVVLRRPFEISVVADPEKSARETGGVAYMSNGTAKRFPAPLF